MEPRQINISKAYPPLHHHLLTLYLTWKNSPSDQENMANFFEICQANTKQIDELTNRVEKLEKILRQAKNNGEASSEKSTVLDKDEMVDQLMKKSQSMENDRMAIVSFNRNNSERDPENKIKWTKITTLKGGRERMLTFTQADDNISLLALIQSEHRSTLCNSGPIPVNITTSISKKYRVVLVGNQLVTLCRDFKGGIGREYLWSSDENMAMNPPSLEWKSEEKKKNDPRRNFIDPNTMEFWIPSDEHNEYMVQANQDNGEEEEEENSTGDESNTGSRGETSSDSDRDSEENRERGDHNSHSKRVCVR